MDYAGSFTVGVIERNDLLYKYNRPLAEALQREAAEEAREQAQRLKQQEDARASRLKQEQEARALKLRQEENARALRLAEANQRQAEAERQKKRTRS